jgi:hypothetical protein
MSLAAIYSRLHFSGKIDILLLNCLVPVKPFRLYSIYLGGFFAAKYGFKENQAAQKAAGYFSVGAQAANGRSNFKTMPK